MPRATKASSTKSTATKKKSNSKKAKASAKKSSKTTVKKAKSSKATKSTKATKKSKSSDKKVSVENLEQLNETGRRKASKPVPVERRKRRRQIDPTTCERDYKDAEIEFMQAMDDYKRQSGRMFPTCSEILEVLMKIGYRQVAAPAELMYDPEEDKKNAVVEESLNTRFEDEEDDE